MDKTSSSFSASFAGETVTGFKVGQELIERLRSTGIDVGEPLLDRRDAFLPFAPRGQRLLGRHVGRRVRLVPR